MFDIAQVCPYKNRNSWVKTRRKPGGRGLLGGDAGALGDEAGFGRVVGGSPEAGAGEGVGQVLLLGVVAGEVVRIQIFLAVAKLFHQPGGGIAQVQGHGQVAYFSFTFFQQPFFNKRPTQPYIQIFYVSL